MCFLVVESTVDDESLVVLLLLVVFSFKSMLVSALITASVPRPAPESCVRLRRDDEFNEVDVSNGGGGGGAMGPPPPAAPPPLLEPFDDELLCVLVRLELPE